MQYDMTLERMHEFSGWRIRIPLWISKDVHKRQFGGTVSERMRGQGHTPLELGKDRGESLFKPSPFRILPFAPDYQKNKSKGSHSGKEWTAFFDESFSEKMGVFSWRPACGFYMVNFDEILVEHAVLWKPENNV